MRAFGGDYSHRADELRLSRLQGPRRTHLRDQRAQEVAWGRWSSTVLQAFGVGWSCPPVPSELDYAELRIHGVLRSSRCRASGPSGGRRSFAMGPFAWVGDYRGEGGSQGDVR